MVRVLWQNKDLRRTVDDEILDSGDRSTLNSFDLCYGLYNGSIRMVRKLGWFQPPRHGLLQTYIEI